MNVELEPGFFPSLSGGLGNQMFAVSAAYILCEMNGCPMYLASQEGVINPHNHKKYDYRQTIFKSFGKHIDLSQDSLKQVLLNSGYKLFLNGGFDKWNPCSIGPNTILESYFQYYPAIAPFEEELRQKFIEGLKQEREALLQNYGDLSSCGFVHIRRGDYMNHPDYHYLQGIDYYSAAEKRLLSFKKPNRLFIVSNDLDWVRSQPFFMENPMYTLFESEDELETLALMSLCTGAAICANSTFSWWGAFLGAHSVKNPVFVPEKWINEPIDCLFPASWHVL